MCQPRFDFFPQLASLQAYVTGADLGICHSEVPFAEKDGPFRNYPLFAAPQEIAPAIKQVGWDLCTTASNHTMDAGWEGLVRTIDVHRAAGILTAGSYATEELAAGIQEMTAVSQEVSAAAERVQAMVAHFRV